MERMAALHHTHVTHATANKDHGRGLDSEYIPTDMYRSLGANELFLESVLPTAVDVLEEN